jgi:hypothetical protein
MADGGAVPVMSAPDSADNAASRDRGGVHAVEHLGSVLERIADALVALDCQAMLSLDADLAAALKSLDTSPIADDGEALVAAARRAQRALLRCRRLGGSLSSLSRTLTRASGAAIAYDRTGTVVGGSSAPVRAVQVSV